ncbi:MAG: 3,4-dihydroxy-2-butanone-4-phosphate synthase [alpha proteobacterium MED-G10]|nr:MAG: 3,4-dihydroxy-2-butanone-4-phosphate synthase [alpha proteobacterium MED-G10]|tara:strand:- start:202 stop:1281 length:1080 start_codon:yes stop_codon:yes gene_type:complete
MKSFLSPISDIINDLSNGKMVVIVDDENRENEGDLMFCGSFVSSEKVNFMAKYARGLICLALDKKRFKKLKLKLMTESNKSKHRTAFTVSIEAKKGVTTGISAKDRAQTIKVAVSPKSKPSDLVSPGHIFPLLASDGGVLVRAGHTEAAVDLSGLSTANQYPYGVICEIMNDDGTMARFDDLVKFCQKHKLRMSSIKDLIEYRIKKQSFVKCIRVENLDLGEEKKFKMFIYKNTIDNTEHIALMKGKVIKGKDILVRMHSLNIFSDLLNAKNDDLKKAIDIISKNDNGIIVIIRNPKKELLIKKEKPSEKKILKEYGIGAQILIDLGVNKIKLLTSSSKNIVGIDGFGLEINGTQKISK